MHHKLGREKNSCGNFGARCRCLFGALLVSCAGGFTVGALSLAPQINSIHFDGAEIIITAEVPSGLSRVVLEGCSRDDLRGWLPRAVQRVDGEGGFIQFTLPASAAAGMEMFRLRADHKDALPASFYQGQSEFEGEWLGSGSAEPIQENGNLIFYQFGNATTTTSLNPSTATDASTLREVEESDIWRATEDRIYFFNRSRGLQILDVADPDAPVLKAVLPIPGAGDQMYLLGRSHVILLLSGDCRNGSSSQVAIVDVRGDVPREITRLPISGRTLESRMVGTALYVASETWVTRPEIFGVWERTVTVSAFDLADPAVPVARPEIELSGAGGVVTATDSHLFITTRELSQPWWASTLNIFDITDPAGVVRPLAEIPLAGRLKDKFKIHQDGDIVVLVTEGPSPADQVWRSELATYRLLPISSEEPRWTRLGAVELGLRETLFATRFEGSRAYIVTYLLVDPLWIVDFSDPANPEIKGELEIPGWSTYIHPMGDRLQNADSFHQLL